MFKQEQNITSDILVQILLEGWSLGLATGVVCLSSCSYIYASCIGREKRTLLQSLSVVFQISIGRFISYFAFGLLAGFLGGQVNEEMRQIFTTISYFLLPILLLYTSFAQKHKTTCSVKQAGKLFNVSNYPVLLGIVTGINVCPSFLLALSNSFSTGGTLSGGIFFIAFFFGTSVFLLPLAFVGLLTHMRKFTVVAKYMSIIIAIWFFYKAGVEARSYYERYVASSSVSTVNFINAKNLTLVYNPSNRELFDTLKKIIIHDTNSHNVQVIPLDSLHNSSYSEAKFIVCSIDDSTSMKMLSKSSILYIIYIDNNTTIDGFNEVECDEYARSMYSFLSFYTFKIEENKGFVFNYSAEKTH